MQPIRIVKTPRERQVAGTMLGLAFWTAISQACGLTALLLFANALSPADFGKLSGAIFLQQFFSTISVSGFRSVVIREIVKRPEHRDAIAGSYLFLAVLLGLLIFLVTAVAVWWLPIESEERTVYLVIALGHVGACLIPNALYDASQSQVRGAAVSASVEIAGTLAIGVGFLLSVITIPVAAALIAGKWIAAAIIGLADYTRQQNDFRPRLDQSQIRSLWKSARLMSFATMLNVAPAALGVPLTRVLFGAGEAGLFAIAAFVFRTHATVAGLLTRTVFPHVAGVYGETGSFKRRLFIAFGCLSASLTAIAVICSEMMLRGFLPEEYHAARWTIALMLVAATIRVGGVLGNMYLITRYRERLLAAIAVGGMLTFAMILVLPMDNAGRNQTALAILGSSIVMTASLLAMFNRTSTGEAMADARGQVDEVLD